MTRSKDGNTRSRTGVAHNVPSQLVTYTPTTTLAITHTPTTPTALKIATSSTYSSAISQATTNKTTTNTTTIINTTINNNIAA
jgi:hypothetical protein